MIADIFKKDYRQMTAQGVKFTPEDIVLLNALAVKVRLTQNAARTTHLPRLAFLPGKFGRFGKFGVVCGGDDDESGEGLGCRPAGCQCKGSTDREC